MLFDKFHVVVTLVTMLIVVAAVLSHYEGLRFLSNWISGTRLRPRFRIAVVIYGLLLLHSIEIWFFGLGYWLLIANADYGTLVGIDGAQGLADCVYFSTTVYSTLGFGDLVPRGPVRFLAGMESVTGLLLITWSASFTYLEMIRYWRKDT